MMNAFHRSSHRAEKILFGDPLICPEIGNEKPPAWSVHKNMEAVRELHIQCGSLATRLSSSPGIDIQSGISSDGEGP